MLSRLSVDAHKADQIASEADRPLDESAPLLDEAPTGVAKDAAVVTPRAVEAALLYGLFMLLGALMLLPWSALIVALEFFHLRLEGSTYSLSVASWLSVVFTSTNVGLYP